jgi:N-acetylmuramoyl-L-alanine amidase
MKKTTTISMFLLLSLSGMFSIKAKADSDYLSKAFSYKKSTKLNSLNSKDRESILRIVEAEATGEDFKGKVLVANVVLNRVKHSKFPNTIYEVIFQKNQFSPITDGRYYSVTITNSTKLAVEQALNGLDDSQGALFFASLKCNRIWFDTNLQKMFTHGGHVFYK